MADERREAELPPYSLVVDGYRVPANVSWPDAVDKKLNAMVAALKEQDTRTSRAELLAAIVVGLELDANELQDILHTYRTLNVGDIVMGLTPSEPEPPDLIA